MALDRKREPPLEAPTRVFPTPKQPVYEYDFTTGATASTKGEGKKDIKDIKAQNLFQNLHL